MAPPSASAAASSVPPPPPPNVISGKLISSQIRGEIAADCEAMKERVVPGLAVILVGSRPDSMAYVKMKKKACAECGINSFGFDYPETVTQEELITKVSEKGSYYVRVLGGALHSCAFRCEHPLPFCFSHAASSQIEELNADPKVHGILVQLPLPNNIVENEVTSAVDPSKDVDGLHPANCAKLVTAQTHGGSVKMNWKDLSSIPFHIACTPQGCIELLDRSGVEIEGKRAVIIGRSNLVGMPVSAQWKGGVE